METVKLTEEVETFRLSDNGGLHSEDTRPETGGFQSRQGMTSHDCPMAPPKTPDPLPSRLLELKPIFSSVAEMEVREALRKEWQLDTVEHSYLDGCSTVRFYDLRESKAAWERLNNSTLDGSTISATFSSKASARDYDEEGRVVVQVGDHLNLDQLIHVFSSYGAVRNIQDVPNISVCKVVEFYDIRDAQKATKALNRLERNTFIVSSVACISKARTQRLLIPPRVSSELEPLFEGHSLAIKEGFCDSVLLQEQRQSPSPEKLKDMTPLSIGGLMPGASSNAFGARSLPDSSSSLASVTDQEESEMTVPHSTEKDTSLLLQQSHLKQQKHHSQFFSFPEGRVLSEPQIEREDRGELSFEDVLPAGLGLYNDEPSQQEETRFHPPSSGLTGVAAMDHQLPGTGLHLPYALNEMTQLSLSKRLANQQLMNNALLARLMRSAPSGCPSMNTQGLLGVNPCTTNTLSFASYCDELQRMTLLQQVVNLEVLKRLNSLKAFDQNGLTRQAPSICQFQRSDEALRRMEKTNRKKQSRTNRKKTAEDLQEEAERRAEQEKVFALDLERVSSGEDKRTTLMIKNIPNKYTQQLLLTRIEESFKGTFDFFYLPIDFKNKCNVGYGFINMTKLEYIAPFVQHVHEQKWDKFNSEKVCCVTYARIQGFRALISHFQNSSLMFEESKHQPMIFDANGEPEPFPAKPAS